jgi:hypothetical protein
MTSRTGLTILLLAGGLGACGSTIHPNVEGPAAAIRAAEEVGAPNVPEAALPLQLAKEQLERAKTMTSETQQPSAERLLLRSQADAELAVAIARSSAARSAAQKAVDKVKNQNAVR